MAHLLCISGSWWLNSSALLAPDGSVSLHCWLLQALYLCNDGYLSLKWLLSPSVMMGWLSPSAVMALSHCNDASTSAMMALSFCNDCSFPLQWWLSRSAMIALSLCNDDSVSVHTSRTLFFSLSLHWWLCISVMMAISLWNDCSLPLQWLLSPLQWWFCISAFMALYLCIDGPVSLQWCFCISAMMVVYLCNDVSVSLQWWFGNAGFFHSCVTSQYHLPGWVRGRLVFTCGQSTSLQPVDWLTI